MMVTAGDGAGSPMFPPDVRRPPPERYTRAYAARGCRTSTGTGRR